jgi:hypothetical protein
MSKYTFQQLVDLWVQAGGNATSGAMAAAVAMAESGGNSDATNQNSNDSMDRGLWQINSIHGGQSTMDPLGNARAAVSISGNGTSWRPWCTAWSDGACGGTYLGDTSPVKKFLSGDENTGAVNASVTSSGLNMLNPQSWAQAFLRPLSVWTLYGAMSMLGAVLVVIGLYLLGYNSPLMSQARAALVSPAKQGVKEGLGGSIRGRVRVAVRQRVNRKNAGGK